MDGKSWFSPVRSGAQHVMPQLICRALARCCVVCLLPSQLCYFQTGQWTAIPARRRRSRRWKEKSFLKRPQSEKTTGICDSHHISRSVKAWWWIIIEQKRVHDLSEPSFDNWSVCYECMTPFYNGGFTQKVFCCSICWSSNQIPWSVIVFTGANVPWTPCGPSLFRCFRVM